MQRCPKCPGFSKPIPPSGPKRARVFAIGEQPGKDEQNMPFQGKAGRELNENYLPVAGLSRDQIYCTNTCKCMWASSGKLPPADVVESCKLFHLERELREVQPEVVVTLGQLAYENVDEWPIDLDRQHGIPFHGSILGYETVLFPMFHPALGLHKEKSIKMLRDDYASLRKYLRGQLVRPTDPCPNPSYELFGARELRLIFDSYFGDGPLATDTESVPKLNGSLTKWEPWCMTFAGHWGSLWPDAFMVMANDADSLSVLAEYLPIWPDHIVLHNDLHDLNEYFKLGVDIDADDNVYDTMERAWHLGLPHQGLKTLSYRLLGIDMQDFDDLVSPYSNEVVKEYLSRASEYKFPKPPQITVWDDEEEDFVVNNPQSLNTKIKRMFTDLRKNTNVNSKLHKELFKRVYNWRTKDPMGWSIMEAMMGTPVPMKSIEHVPFEKAKKYSCTDARATLLLYEELKKYRTRPTLRRKVI